MCSDVFGRQHNVECFSSAYRVVVCIKIHHIVSEKIMGTVLTFINDCSRKRRIKIHHIVSEKIMGTVLTFINDCSRKRRTRDMLL